MSLSGKAVGWKRIPNSCRATFQCIYSHRTGAHWPDVRQEVTGIDIKWHNQPMEQKRTSRLLLSTVMTAHNPKWGITKRNDLLWVSTLKRSKAITTLDWPYHLPRHRPRLLEIESAWKPSWTSRIASLIVSSRSSKAAIRTWWTTDRSKSAKLATFTHPRLTDLVRFSSIDRSSDSCPVSASPNYRHIYTSTASFDVIVRQLQGS